MRLLVKVEVLHTDNGQVTPVGESNLGVVRGRGAVLVSRASLLGAAMRVREGRDRYSRRSRLALVWARLLPWVRTRIRRNSQTRCKMPS